MGFQIPFMAGEMVVIKDSLEKMELRGPPGRYFQSPVTPNFALALTMGRKNVSEFALNASYYI